MRGEGGGRGRGWGEKTQNDSRNVKRSVLSIYEVVVVVEIFCARIPIGILLTSYSNLLPQFIRFLNI